MGLVRSLKHAIVQRPQLSATIYRPRSFLGRRGMGGAARTCLGRRIEIHLAAPDLRDLTTP